MKHFPIFLNVEAATLVVAGGGEAAMAKLRLLLKTDAKIIVYATKPAAKILLWADEGRLQLIRRTPRAGDITGARLFYAANENATEDARTSEIAQNEGALVNIVDNLDDSEFITPAIVDRDPVTVAIGTQGTAPVLARAIKRDLEAKLHPKLGKLAQVANNFRPMVKLLPLAPAKRAFWEDFFLASGPQISEISDETVMTKSLHSLLHRHLTKTRAPAHVDFIGSGTGDPELLTLKARNALNKADVIIHDPQVAPEILELTRREAIFLNSEAPNLGRLMGQDNLSSLILSHGEKGHHIVRLMAGDLADPERYKAEVAALDSHGLDWQIIPGVSVNVRHASCTLAMSDRRHSALPKQRSKPLIQPAIGELAKEAAL